MAALGDDSVARQLQEMLEAPSTNPQSAAAMDELSRMLEPQPDPEPQPTPPPEEQMPDEQPQPEDAGLDAEVRRF